MTMYADRALHCVSCGQKFVFSAREQEFHAARGFTNEPRRCLVCRQARRTTTNRDTAPLRPGMAGSVAATSPGETSARPTEQRQTFIAPCSACGGEALLPYEPVGNRPVLCSTCYDKIRAPV